MPIDRARDAGLDRRSNPKRRRCSMQLARVAARIAAGLVLAAATVPDVRAQDRTDLLEVGPVSTGFMRSDGTDYVRVQFTDTANGSTSAAHVQSIRVNHELAGADTLGFRMYEPDKVTRKSDFVKWQQG